MANEILLSIVIPARHEEWLSRTVADLLKNIRGNTEILIGLDGEWCDPPIPAHERVTIFYSPVSLGQRGMTDQLVRLAKGKWIAKTDAHCSFDEGFDVKLLDGVQDDWTVVPIMRHLHVFDWVCPDGHRRYQGPSGPCTICNKETKKDVVWISKESPKSRAYCFDSEPHFQYYNKWTHSEQYKQQLLTGFTESMSIQGSFFAMTREKYWQLKMDDPGYGSWGSQGIQVACSTWLTGGKVMINHKTWYCHCFRTQGRDFGFPYPQSGNQVQRAKAYAKELFFNNKFEGQTKPFYYILSKFWPVPGWTEEQLVEHNNKAIKFFKEKIEYAIVRAEIAQAVVTKELESMPEFLKAALIASETKGIIYYTDNALNLRISHAVQDQLKKANLPIISASLKPMSFGKNIVVKGERGYLTMARQILAGLEASDAEIIFFCEHDVLMHPSHFNFIPPDKNKYYYNTHVYRVRASDGHALYCDELQQLSGLCAYRETLLKHYRERVRRLEENSDSSHVRKMGFEPGTHNRPERIDDLKAESWQSEFPNIDIRHDGNLTPSRWRKDQFRNERYTRGWKETTVTQLPGWSFKQDAFFYK